jgi:hypothetical protein
MKAKNPHANPDGTPKDGEEFLFLDWSINKDKNRIKDLPAEKKKIDEKSKNKMKDKMES